MFAHNLINIHKPSPFCDITTCAHAAWEHVRNINAWCACANEIENKERKLSNQSNTAKHEYFTVLRWICVCVPRECISNMYEVISWQKLLQEKDESCFMVFTVSKTSARVHQHMHRRSSKRYMWRKQARHVCLYLLVCLSQIYIFNRSLN